MKNVAMVLTTLLFALLITSCDDNRVFEENTDIKMFDWTYENVIKFEVEIADSLQKNVLINFRHTHFFESRNVILKMDITAPSGEKKTLDVNIPLSEPNGMWYAECAGDICDLQYAVPSLKNYAFSEKGKYVFGITQNMRNSPLQSVMSVGLRIENAAN